MKILIYSHFFAPSVGGVETIVRRLAQGLATYRNEKGEQQFDVTVATQTSAGNYADNSGEWKFRTVRQPGIRELWRLVRGADLVHLAGPALTPLLLARMAGKPTVVEHHGYQSVCVNGLFVHQPDEKICPGHFQAAHYSECFRCVACETSAVRSGLQLALMFPRSWLTRKAARNIAVSQYVMERCGLPRSSVVYHGVEAPVTANGEATAHLAGRGASNGEADLKRPQLECEKICFAYIGRFVWEKGISILLQAARLLRNAGCDFELQLIGDGPQRSEVEEIIAREDLGEHVRITGYLTGTALEASLADVRAVVMPSMVEETAGLAAIEQMMRGRLVIASKIGGLQEIVGDAGMTFAMGDAAALAECMKRVIGDPEIVEVLGGKARERALKYFTQQRMIGGHVEVYREAMTKNDLGR